MNINPLNDIHSDHKGVYYWVQETLDDLPLKHYIVEYGAFVPSPYEDFIPFNFPKL